MFLFGTYLLSILAHESYPADNLSSIGFENIAEKNSMYDVEYMYLPAKPFGKYQTPERKW
jgi:hypothetical protein